MVDKFNLITIIHSCNYNIIDRTFIIFLPLSGFWGFGVLGFKGLRV